MDGDFHDAESYGGVLRDLSASRFSAYHDLIYGPAGVNDEAEFQAGNAEPPQGLRALTAWCLSSFSAQRSM